MTNFDFNFWGKGVKIAKFRHDLTKTFIFELSYDLNRLSFASEDQEIQVFEKMYYFPNIWSNFGLMGQLGVDQISQACAKRWNFIPNNCSESRKLITYEKHLQLSVKLVKIYRKGEKMVICPTFDPQQRPVKMLRILKPC